MNNQNGAIYNARELGTQKMLVLGLQHLFAMFGATVLVPILTGLSVSTTLLFAGLATLFCHFVTGRKVPVFLGSSFAFLGGYFSVKAMAVDAGYTEAQGLVYACVGIACAGLMYLILALICKGIGAHKVMRFFPHYFGDYAFFVYLDDITISTEVPAGEWVDAGTTTTNSMTLNLEYGKAYDARVMAECSDYSEPINFTTDALKRFTTEGDWSVADNWTPAGVPTINDDVTIEAAASITEVAYANNITIEGGSITIENGGQLVHNNAGVTATVKKSIVGVGEENWNQDYNGGYYFISNPLTTSVDPENAGLITEGDNYDLYDWYANDYNGLEWNNYKDWEFNLSYYNHPGYLYANKDDVTLAFTGTVYNSNNRISVSTYYNSGAEFAAWNLLGNPFICNAYLVDNAGNALPFYKMNVNGDGYDAVEGQPIAPVEGIFYETSANSTVYFTREIPASKGGSLNMVVSQGRGTVDNAIIRFGEGQQMSKFSFREGSTKIYIPMEGKDYAIVNATNENEMPVSFKAESNGTYTLSFVAQEVEFGYLHLIDNMTGADVDLLANSSYTFETRTTDYANRFRLVFAAGNNGSEDNFAFFSNGSFVINNEGMATVQVIDINGRILSSESINGCANINVNAAAGVYVLRLINGENVKVQKVVVR